MRPLPIRIRKLIGTVALLVLVILWSLLAMALAQAIELQSSPVLEFAYYYCVTNLRAHVGQLICRSMGSAVSV